MKAYTHFTGKVFAQSYKEKMKHILSPLRLSGQLNGSCCYAVPTFPNLLVFEAVQSLKNANEWQSYFSWQPEASRAYVHAVFIQ
jgi:hypothetical protein